MAPISPNTQLNLRLPTDEKFRLEAIAFDLGVSLSGLARGVLGDRAQQYAQEHGGMDRIVGQYRDARIRDIEAEIAGLQQGM